MSDADVLVELERELRNDPDAPTIDLVFDPFDLQALGLIYVQAENLIDVHMERYRQKYGPRFEDPNALDDFILRHKGKIKNQISHMIEEAQETAREAGYNFDPSNGGGLVN